jgi:phosphohistidine phosphatase
MRHAKAEAFASTDHERHLVERGTAAARAAGTELRERGLLPDYALVSSAVRTRETWEALVETSDASCPVSFDDALFTGSFHVVLEALHALPEDFPTVLFLGHNPTAEYLVHHLDDGNGDAAAVSQLLTGFPPAAVAVLELSVGWPELGEETARVTGYFVP